MSPQKVTLSTSPDVVGASKTEQHADDIGELPIMSSSISVSESPSSLYLATTTSNGTTYVFVNASMPDAFPNASACAPTLQDAEYNDCNLRSAVAFCASFLGTPGRECVISLPALASLYMDPSLGELFLLDLMQGEMRVEGNGCNVSLMLSGAPATRFFSVQDTAALQVFSFKVSNLTISGFGSDLLDGGAMFFRGVSVTVDSVVFLANAGLAGGAVCFHRCRGIAVLSSQFVNNTASSDGGGMFLSMENEGVMLMSCDFLGNSVLATRTSTLGTGGFTGECELWS